MDLQKRYQGLHYEVGQLPERLIESSTYWKLPYNLRRLLHVTCAPGSFRYLHRMRKAWPENLNNPSLKPFCDTQSIFVHVPKAAGISVGFSLYGRKTGDHRTIADYKLCFGKKEFDSFFKFTFVRNPWDRLLSAYMYLKGGGRNESDYKWSVKYLSSYTTFEAFVTDWVNKDNIRLGLHFRPQFEFLCDEDGVPEVDFVGYYESINSDYEYIKQKIGSGGKLTSNNKTSNKKDYRQYYSDRTIAIVESVYSDDIRIFGYTFDGLANSMALGNRRLMAKPEGISDGN